MPLSKKYKELVGQSVKMFFTYGWGWRFRRLESDNDAAFDINRLPSSASLSVEAFVSFEETVLGFTATVCAPDSVIDGKKCLAIAWIDQEVEPDKRGPFLLVISANTPLTRFEGPGIPKRDCIDPNGVPYWIGWGLAAPLSSTAQEDLEKFARRLKTDDLLSPE